MSKPKHYSDNIQPPPGVNVGDDVTNLNYTSCIKSLRKHLGVDENIRYIGQFGYVGANASFNLHRYVIARTCHDAVPNVKGDSCILDTMSNNEIKDRIRNGLIDAQDVVDYYGNEWWDEQP